MNSGQRTRNTARMVKAEVVSIFLICSMLLTLIVPAGHAASQERVDPYVPERAADGKPIFDGKPEHLTPFVNFIMDHDMSHEDLIALANTHQPAYEEDKQANMTRTIKAGYTLPLFLNDNAIEQGVHTDFPAFIGIGNSWNKNLAHQIGSVIGNEKRGTVSIEDSGKNLMWSAIGGIHHNPLSGQFEEGLSEDPYMASVLGDTMASGISGVNLGDGDPDNDFYLKTVLLSKYYPLYNSQWFRKSGSYNVSSRALHEFQLPTFLRQISNASVAGFKTSYGRMNGIPTGISPSIDTAKEVAPYSPLPFTDFGAFDVSTEVLKEAVRPVLELLVRLGYFNERNGNGQPLGYPYNDLLNGAKDENDPQSQATALQSARESIVLLKNNATTLPLSADAKVAVIGQYANIKNKGANAVPNTPKLDDAGLTIADGIRTRIGYDNITEVSGGKVVAWKSNATGKFLTADTNTGILKASAVSTVTFDVYMKNNANTVPGTKSYNLSDGTYLSKNEAFEIYDWGQNAYSFKTMAEVNGGFLQKLLNLVMIKGGKPTKIEDTVFSYESTWDGKSIRQGAFTGSLLGGFENHALTNGSYLRVAGDAVNADIPVALYKLTKDRSSLTYKEVVLRQAGQEADVLALNNDYAVVVIGALARMNSSEGVDRASLNMGADQIDMVSNVAAAFKKEGKKTIVVINSNFPVAVDDIHNDPNVDAIVFSPYGGQYQGKALSEVLFGDYAPTGHLHSTWYKDTATFPRISQYNLPEGNANFTSLADIDPRYTIDMQNADPAESKLTYRYTDAAVTYPLGYGLNYSTFAYSNLKVPASINSDKKFVVLVDVKNTGNVDTSDVVQLYVSPQNSAYGSEVPKKQLAAFEKVFIPAGETKTVSLTVDPKDFAIWDVNAKKSIVESGNYKVMIGGSSADSDLKLSAIVRVGGTDLSVLKLTEPKNVWDHAYAGHNLVYREISNERTTANTDSYYSVMSTGADSWVGIPNVSLDNATSVKINVATRNLNSVIEVRKDSPTGEKLATLKFTATKGIAYKVQRLDGSNATLYEAGYQMVAAPLNQPVKGKANLYLVFDKKDIRVDSIQLTGE